MNLEILIGMLGQVVISVGVRITNKYGIELSPKLLSQYFNKLIGDHYKILPLIEGRNFKTKEIVHTPEQAYKMFKEYLNNYVYEICGGYALFDNSEYFLTLLNNLEGMKKIQINEHAQLKSLVMKSINICKKLKQEADAMWQ
jgi:hypothetical protein